MLVWVDNEFVSLSTYFILMSNIAHDNMSIFSLCPHNSNYIKVIFKNKTIFLQRSPIPPNLQLFTSSTQSTILIFKNNFILEIA